MKNIKDWDFDFYGVAFQLNDGIEAEIDFKNKELHLEYEDDLRYTYLSINELKEIIKYYEENKHKIKVRAW